MREETERKRGGGGGGAAQVSSVSLPTASRKSLSFRPWPDFHCRCTRNIPSTFVVLFLQCLFYLNHSVCPSSKRGNLQFFCESVNSRIFGRSLIKHKRVKHLLLLKAPKLRLSFQKQQQDGQKVQLQANSRQALKPNPVCQETNDKLQNHLAPNNSFKKTDWLGPSLRYFKRVWSKFMDTATDCNEIRGLFLGQPSLWLLFFFLLFAKRCVHSEAIQLASARRCICEAASGDPEPSDHP